jgi:2-hydroxy-6-oxonona-2,4-dienedioate hydrolase
LPSIDSPNGSTAQSTKKLMRGDTECLPAVEYVKGWRAARPILLLPGLFAGDWIWKPAWDCLIAGGFSVAKLTEPFAALDTESTSIDSLRSVVMGVLDEYEIREAVLCGNSLGGLVALDAAAHHPDRIESLVISGCPGLGGDAGLGLRSRGEFSRPDAREIAEKMFFDRSSIPAELIEQSCARVTDRRCARNIIRYLIAIREYDVRSCLSQIQCDVLMIWGENDPIAPVEEWENNLHRTARGRLRKLARCGHSPMIEKPAEFNAILSDFLAQTHAA